MNSIGPFVQHSELHEPYQIDRHIRRDLRQVTDTSQEENFQPGHFPVKTEKVGHFQLDDKLMTSS